MKKANFHDVLSNAGRSFLRAFLAAILVFAPGVAQAPNLDAAKVLGVAALVASLAAGLRAIQDFVPQLQFNWKWNNLPVGDYVGSFSRAFLGSFLVSIIGILDAPSLSFGSSVVTGAITAALAAGLLAIQKLAEHVETTPQVH